MILILTLFPPLFIRLVVLLKKQKLSFQDGLASFGQELFFGQLLFFLFFLLEYHLFFISVFLAQAYLLLDAFFSVRLQTRWEFSYLSFYKEGLQLGSSFKEVGGYFFLGSLFSLFLFNLFFFFSEIKAPSFSFWMIFPFALSALGFTKCSYEMRHPFLFFLKKRLPSPLLKREPISASGPFTAKPHLIFLFMESFRAKDIGERESPHFCALMQEGIYFSHFYANAVKSCLASIAALNGMAPTLHAQGYSSAYLHNGSLTFQGQRNLFTQLGFQTLIGRNELLSVYPHARGNSWGIYDEYLMQYAVDYLDKRRGSPLFMTLATMTNHHPWTPPPGYEMKKTARERFSQTYRYSDAALGDFIRRLKEKNLYKESLIFILGDHGQPLGEHGETILSQNGLYEEHVHIPLLILGKGIEGPTVRHCIGSQVDLLPTLMDLLGIPSSQSLLCDKEKRAAFFYTPFEKGYLGCREENYKYILTTSTGEEALYDLEKDPEERINLASLYPERLKQYAQAVTSYAFPSCAYSRSFPETLHFQAPSPLEMSDDQLKKIVKSNPKLQIIDLKECLLLSDRGIRSLLKYCPHLEQLLISGVNEITDAAFSDLPAHSPKMVALEMLDCPKITLKSVALLLKSSPNLHRLKICCASIDSLPNIACSALRFLHIQQGDALSDEKLLSFLEQQVHLEYLFLEDCHQLTDETLSRLHAFSLTRLTLFSCSKMTDQGLLTLQNSSLALIEIFNCPQISPQAIQTLTDKGHRILC